MTTQPPYIKVERDPGLTLLDCPKCNATGYVQAIVCCDEEPVVNDPCDWCNAEGYLEADADVQKAAHDLLFQMSESDYLWVTMNGLHRGDLIGGLVQRTQRVIAMGGSILTARGRYLLHCALAHEAALIATLPAEKALRECFKVARRE